MRYTYEIDTAGFTQRLRSIRADEENPRIAGALITAAIKDLRSGYYLWFVQQVEDEFELDITPHLAMKICKSLWGVSPSVARIEDIWQRQGRTSHSVTPNVDGVLERVRADADALKAQLAEAISHAKAASR